MTTAQLVGDWHGTVDFNAAEREVRLGLAHVALTQETLAGFMSDGGFARHVRRMNRVYQARHEALVSSLERDFADVLEVVPSDAGLHVCALARETTGSVDEVVRRAADDGVAVQGLSRLGVAAPAPPGLMLGYGAISRTDIPEGLRRLRQRFDDTARPRRALPRP